MSFTTEEQAAHAVVHLFTFQRASTQWHYTDAPADVVVDGITYRAASVQREGLRRSSEDVAGELLIPLALATPLAQHIVTEGLGRTPLGCIVRAQHVASEGDVGAVPAAPVVVFSGVVRARTVDDAAGRLTLRVASFLGELDRPILTILTSPTCNNSVYDRRCGVRASDFAAAGTITAVAGRVATVLEADAFVDGWYTAGMLRVESGALAGRLFHIETHLGDALTLLEAPPAALVGAAVTLFAGCDGTFATCRDKFHNVRHFLGFPRVPATNPFEDAEA